MILTINADTLRNSFLFKDVDQSILEEVAKHCQAMELHAGETLLNRIQNLMHSTFSNQVRYTLSATIQKAMKL